MHNNPPPLVGASWRVQSPGYETMPRHTECEPSVKCNHTTLLFTDSFLTLYASVAKFDESKSVFWIHNHETRSDIEL